MTFLQIPVEIRLNVMKQAIYSLGDPPSCPTTSQEGRKRLPRGECFGGGIWQLPLRNPALPLLLVNKQLCGEVKDIIRLMTTDYHVDIMFLKSHGLWTTWTVPVLPQTQYIDSVHATFRPFEPTEDLDTSFGSLDFHNGDGGPPTAVWSFHSLLTDLLAAGPGYQPKKQEGIRSRYVVKRIIVDVVAPIDGAAYKSIFWEDERYEDEVSPRQDGRGPHDASIAPEQRLANYMIENLDRLLHLTYYTMDYGAIVYESVLEDITILVNGSECKRYDMNELMREHKMEYWGETRDFIARRKRAHGRWKTWVHERRERMKEGLKLDNHRPVTYIFMP